MHKIVSEIFMKSDITVKARKFVWFKLMTIIVCCLAFFNKDAYSIALNPKKVLFIVHTETMNGKGVKEIYARLKKRGHHVKIAIMPMLAADSTVLYDMDENFAKKFDSADVFFPCERPYKKCKDLPDYTPDFTIVQNPYNYCRESIAGPYYSLEALKKKSKKLAYLIYSSGIFHPDSWNNDKLKNVIDIVFVDSESTKKKFVDMGFSSDNVIVSGLPSYKNVRNQIPASTKFKETVLWLPRWRLDFTIRKEHEGGSTFLSYYHFFLNYAKENPDMRLIVRPHVNLFPHGVRFKFFSEKDVEDIKRKFHSLDNVVFSEHINQPLEDDIVQANVVIGDETGALSEVVIADKPIIYLSNGWDDEFESSDLGKQLKKFIYLAHSPQEIIDHLAFIRKTGYVPYAKKLEPGRIGRFFGSKDWEVDALRDSFKEEVDPVEHPADFIAGYIESH